VARITFNDQVYHCVNNESVLDCLTRHGVSIPSSCKSGVCQTCLMRGSKGKIPKDAQLDLKPSLVNQNYFFSCVCKPTQDINIHLPDEDINPKLIATVIQKNKLQPGILQLILQSQSPFNYQAGQFLNLTGANGITRSYSIASLPQANNQIELHIKKIASGNLSTWIFDELEIAQEVLISGPHGDCYYMTEHHRHQPLLLIGTGTGLAPLYGIIQDALYQKHTQAIHLFHGSRATTDLYLVDTLLALKKQHKNFNYTPCLSGSSSFSGATKGRADVIALQQHPKLKGWQVFLCGHPDMVNTMKKKSFLQGAALQAIHTDSFVHNHHVETPIKPN